ncbi:MAG: hypothetical protein ACFFE8_08405 [Candidatus Heimdallarchaeota archaeon]
MLSSCLPNQVTSEDAANRGSQLSAEGIYYANKSGMDAGMTVAHAIRNVDFSPEFLTKNPDPLEI